MSNSEGITYQDAVSMQEVGSFRNNWRRRTVTVYQHPDDCDKVVTVGVPYGSENDADSYLVCVEDYSRYKHRIEYNDWSAYD